MWNAILTCERCEEKFNSDNRAPLILPDCGHTFCEYCVADLKSEMQQACPTCQTEIKTNDLAKFIKNQKILTILQRVKDGLSGPEQLMMFSTPEGDFVFCPRHTDKPIEYFCKQCSITVCVKCMFDEHNGHELIQIEEMATSLKQNVLDLQKMLVNAQRLNDENQKLVDQVKEELNRLKFQQMKNIDKGFQELQKKLEDKKQEIKFEFDKQDSPYVLIVFLGDTRRRSSVSRPRHP